MKKVLHTLVCLFALVGTSMAQSPSGSDYLVARAIPSKTLFYQYSGTGTLMPKIRWGLDEAWCSETNMLQGRNYLDLFNQNVSIVRLSFQPAWALSNGGLTSNHINGTSDIVGLTERIRVLNLLGTKPEIFLNCDPTSLGIHSDYKGSGTTVVNNWVNLIKGTGQYVESQGFTVSGIAPFNEPDLSSTGYPSASVMNSIMSSLKSNSWGKSKKLLAGNTLSPDYYTTWYSTCKSNTDEGNTHQLAGTFANFTGFMQLMNTDGKLLCQDEMHNVMEAMVGANYGMDDAIWWGTSEHTRSQFCRANDGTGYRLAYREDSGTFTAASVYRNTQDGVTEAYVGCSERQATETSYGFVSTDRDVYYDGYGPTRAYYQHMPADPNGSYQTTAQKNAECVINIQSGEDVQPFPTVGEFQIMNVANGKVIQGNPSWTGWSSNQATLASGTGADGQGWRIEAVPEDQGGDFSYYTIHSYNGQWWDYYLDDNEWGFEEANPIIMYPGGGSGCEQWYFVYAGDGSFYIHNRYSNLCLDGSDGTNLVQRTRTNATSQRWKLVDPTCTPDRTAPAAPTGLTAISLLAAVQLSWTANAETDVRGYTIMRTVKGQNDWNTIARAVEGTTYVDNTVVQGTEYTYKLKAIDLSCNLSSYSSTVNGKASAAQGLVAQWEFDGNARDKSTNQMGCAVYSSSYTAENKSGSKALSFDGSSNYALLPYQVGNMSAMTFCGWVYWEGGNSWQRIFDFGTGEDSYLFLTPSDGSTMRFEIKANGTTQNLTATKLGTGAWKHVAVTIASGSVKIYVDGSQVASSTSITLTPADVAGICNYLGRSQFIADPLFKGTLDDVRIYNYVLSRSEIQSIINSVETSEGITEWAAGGSYYLYNVEAGQFLNQGNDWGTRASLADAGLLWSVSNGSRSGLYRLSRSGESNYLFIANSIVDLYVDGSSNHDFAMVQDLETGFTTISANPYGTYGTSAYGETYLGWSGEDEITWLLPVLKTTDHCRPGTTWLLMTSTEYNKYKSTINASYTARRAMLPMVQSARAAGIDIADVWEVFSNPGATASELTAARTSLLSILNNYASTTASQENPMDMTYLIDHPSCGSDTFSGWTSSGGGWSSNTSYYRNGEAVLQGRFTETWVAGPATLEARTISQSLSGLPAGRYQLTADVIATQQSDGNLTVSGVLLNAGGHSTSCATGNGAPQTFVTPFAVGTGGTATIGLSVESTTTANWVAFDNFRLLYLGPILRGDVNKDKVVSLADVAALIHYLTTKDATGYDLDAADLDGNGSVGTNDLDALLDILLRRN